MYRCLIKALRIKVPNRNIPYYYLINNLSITILYLFLLFHIFNFKQLIVYKKNQPYKYIYIHMAIRNSHYKNNNEHSIEK